MDVAEDIILTELGQSPAVTRSSLTLGYAGVYSSFLRHAENAEKRFGVPAAKILEEVGQAVAVGDKKISSSRLRSSCANAHRRTTSKKARTVNRTMTTIVRIRSTAQCELFAAYKERREIRRLRDAWPGLDRRTAYHIQKRLVTKQVEDEATRIAGIKLGLTSKAKQLQMKVGEPIYGLLLGSRMIGEGEALSVASLIHPKAEPEIALLTSHALQGPGVTVEAARDAIGAVMVGMEIIDSRYKDFRFTLPDVVADNTSAARYAISSYLLPAKDLHLRTLGVVFEKNGEVVTTAAGAAILGDPANALAWLANKLAEHGESLPAGTLVGAGALTDAVSIAPGDVVRVSIAQLGSLSIRCI